MESMQGPPYERLVESGSKRRCWGKCPKWLGGGHDNGRTPEDEDAWWDEDHLAAQNVQRVIERLQRHVRALHVQLAGIKHDEDEATMEARLSLKSRDDMRARAHAARALQHRALWARENAKLQNLNQVLISVREAERNVHMTKLMKESSCTLGEMRDQLEAQGGAEDIMARIREQVQGVARDTETLAESIGVEDPGVDEELQHIRQQMEEEEAAQLELPAVPQKTRNGKKKRQGVLLVEAK